MKTVAALYTDEDMSALVATLLRARGLDITTVPEQGTLVRAIANNWSWQLLPPNEEVKSGCNSCLVFTFYLKSNRVIRYLAGR